jgi:transcriptional regulator with XRE-family HTH domain
VQSTVKPLADLRAHWKAIGCPPISPIAKKANIPSATANRYLSGTTKGGTAETIRALAIAMDRPDIAASIPYTSIGDVEHAEDYIVELLKQWDEASQQRLNEQENRHKQELELIAKDHRAEREDWHKQRDAYCREIERISTSFDNLTKIQHREKWISFAVFLAAVAALIFK